MTRPLPTQSERLYTVTLTEAERSALRGTRPGPDSHIDTWTRYADALDSGHAKLAAAEPCEPPRLEASDVALGRRGPWEDGRI